MRGKEGGRAREGERRWERKKKRRREEAREEGTKQRRKGGRETRRLAACTGCKKAKQEANNKTERTSSKAHRDTAAAI